MKQLTTEEVKQKIENRENFVLDLFATWCGPCKVMLNNLEKVNETLLSESTNKFNLNIYKYDIDEDREFVLNEMKIRSVPTVKIFREGSEVFSKVGVMSVTEVINEVTNRLK